MHTPRLNRRAFLALAAPTAAAHAIEPIGRAGTPRFQHALAAYSFRPFFPYVKGKEQNAPDGADQIDMFGFIDYCADHNVGAELTSYFFPPDADSAYFHRIRRHAFLRGVAVTGTAVGNDFAHPKGDARKQQIDYTKKWIDHAAEMGAPHVRVFAGPVKKSLSKSESKKLCTAALQECCDYAGSKGVFLGIENHGGIVAEADDLLDLVHAVDSPWFGINLDTGNFHTADPYGDLAKCAPYAINVQLKVEMRPADKPDEPADFARLAEILRNANYQGHLTLEYEAKDNPFEAVPNYLNELKKHF